MDLLRNPGRCPLAVQGAPPRDALAFHRRLPGYHPTPLVKADRLAARLAVAQVWVKDESTRLGLPAFKILGASWATYCALLERFGAQLNGWQTFDDLAARTRGLGPLTLATATDGNHGRALARLARLLGFSARIYVPTGTAQARINTIANEDASVEIVDGSYGDAVLRAAEDESERCLVVSDTAWPGYDRIPRWVIEGYSTILWEIEDEFLTSGCERPTVVVVQMGVGAFAAAVVRHFRGHSDDPLLIGVEPTNAACGLASAKAGRIASMLGPHRSIMAGLNCDAPSAVAWPTVHAGIDWFVAIDDEWAREGMRALAEEGIIAGATGAAGLAGLLALRETEAGRVDIGLGGSARVLLICTEGVTDPAAYHPC